MAVWRGSRDRDCPGCTSLRSCLLAFDHEYPKHKLFLQSPSQYQITCTALAMEQTKALNALEPFLALSKSATSPRAASDLIVQATSAPNTYVFAELLQTPNIQNLRTSEEHGPYLALLEIFAWGTWADYKGGRRVQLLPT